MSSFILSSSKVDMSIHRSSADIFTSSSGFIHFQRIKLLSNTFVFSFVLIPNL